MMMAGTVQYDDEAHSRIQKTCDFFSKYDDYVLAPPDTKNSSFKGLKKKFKKELKSMMFERDGSEEVDECVNFSYKLVIDMMKEVSPYDTQERGHFVEICTDVYGKDRNYIDAHVKFTNDYYGGQDNYNGTNVVFVNGSEDPWNPLSVYKPKTSLLFLYGLTGVLTAKTCSCWTRTQEYPFPFCFEMLQLIFRR
uniref:Uncharacterized protein n=1 Tax=Ditylenchus dipsaci TaxID=166011 RepID=A0A915CPM0_9BILA